MQFDVAVDSDVLAVPGSRRVVGETGEAVRGGNEALLRVGADLPGRPSPGADREALVAPLDAGGIADPPGHGVRDVEVQADLFLVIAAGAEVARRLRPERRVDGVPEEEVRPVRTEAGGNVPGKSVVELPPEPRGGRALGHHAAELRSEAARSHLLEGETIRIGKHLGKGNRVRHVVGDPDLGAVGRAQSPCTQDISDQQRLASVQAVDALPRVRVSKEEAFGHRPLGMVGETVEFQTAVRTVTEVGEQLHVVVDLRVAPDLRRYGDMMVAGGNQRGRVQPLDAAVGRIGAAGLEAQVGEAVRPHGQTEIAGDAVPGAVAADVAAAVQLDAAAGRVVLEQEIDDAGNRVRTVLRRGAVAQHLDSLQRDRRNGRDVRSLRAIRHAAEPGDHRGPVPPLAVDQDQRVVVSKIAQAGRPHQGGGIADRMRRHVEGRHQVAQLLVELRRALAHDVIDRNRVDGDLGLGHRTGIRTAAEDDDPFFEPRLILVFRSLLGLVIAAMVVTFLGDRHRRREQEQQGQGAGCKRLPPGNGLRHHQVAALLPE